MTLPAMAPASGDDFFGRLAELVGDGEPELEPLLNTEIVEETGGILSG